MDAVTTAVIQPIVNTATNSDAEDDDDAAAQNNSLQQAIESLIQLRVRDMLNSIIDTLINLSEQA